MLFQVPRLCRAMAAAEIYGLLTVAGCAPRPRLEFPAPEDEPPVAIRTVVEGFKPHHRLSLGLGEGEPVEASFRRLEGDSLLVKELYWK